MAKQLKCTNCGGSTQITESRHVDGCIYRKYKCIKCSYVFFTKEAISAEGQEAINKYHREYYRSRKAGNG